MKHTVAVAPLQSQSCAAAPSLSNLKVRFDLHADPRRCLTFEIALQLSLNSYTFARTITSAVCIDLRRL